MSSAARADQDQGGAAVAPPKDGDDVVNSGVGMDLETGVGVGSSTNASAKKGADSSTSIGMGGGAGAGGSLGTDSDATPTAGQTTDACESDILTKLRSELSARDRKVGQLEQKAGAAQHTCKRLREQRGKDRDQFEECYDDAEAEILRLNDAVGDLKANLGTSVAEASRLRTELSSRHREIGKVTAEAAVLKVDIERLQMSEESNHRLQSEADRLKANLDTSVAEASKLGTELSSRDRQIGKVTAEATVLKADNERLQMSEESNNRADRLKANVDTSLAVAKLTAELETANMRIKDLEQQRENTWSFRFWNILGHKRSIEGADESTQQQNRKRHKVAD